MIKKFCDYLYIVIPITILFILSSILFFPQKAVSITENLSHSPDSNFITSTQPLNLEKGKYSISLSYTTVEDAEIIIYVNPNQTIYSTLSSDSNLFFQEFVSEYPTGDFKIQIVSSENADFSLLNGTLSSSELFNNDYFFLLIVIGIIAVLLLYYKKTLPDRKQTFTLLILTITIILASLPLFSNQYRDLLGQDLLVHLSRIEGIKDGILSGQFPVRIYPNSFWRNGILACLYPDTLLYIPAFLRLCGVSYLLSYQFFLLLINIFTITGIYFCIKSITSESNGAILAAVVYGLAPYRLNCLYIRSALGESLAMLFFPFIIAGLYHLFLGNKKKSYLLIIGYIGLLSSHMLCTLLAILLSIMIGIIFLQNILKEQRIKYLLIVLLSTILIKLDFIVAFIHYSQEELSLNELTRNIVDSLLSPLSLFKISVTNYDMTMILKEHSSIGISGLLCLIFILILLLSAPKESLKKFAISLFIICLFFLVLTTTLFPWAALTKINLLYQLSSILQFAWRLLGLCTIILCMLIGMLFPIASTRFLNNPRKCAITLIGSFAICILSIIPIYQAYFTQTNFIGPYSGVTTSGRTQEYLPKGTHELQLAERTSATVSNTNVIYAENYIKNGTSCSFQYTCTEDEQWAELPLLYYSGYVCYDTDNEGIRTDVKLTKGENNRIRIPLQNCEQFHSIKLYYKGFWYFNLAFVLSTLTFIIFIFTLIYYSRHNNKISR